MTRREKIMVAMTAVVAVVGLGSLLVGKGSSRGAPEAPRDQAAMAQVETLEKGAEAAGPSALDTAMLAAIRTPWRAQAAYERSLTGKAPPPKPSSLPRYTGYVELGSGRLAVVDGFEYQVGDSLEGGGYKVAAISPDKVFLESLANGNRVEVPYEGQEAQ
jgi:hypothetical protein